MQPYTPTLGLRFHHTTPPDACLRLAAQVRVDEAGLRIDYCLRAAPPSVRMPAPTRARQADLLWQHTCFEAFVAAENAAGGVSAAYREFNFSPSGEWAMYAFERYRTRREPQPTAQAAPEIIAGWADGAFRLSARIAAADLPARDHGRAFRLGVCAVIEEPDGRLSYWAFRHHPDQPDFHDRDTFSLRLPAAPLPALAPAPVHAEDAP